MLIDHIVDFCDKKYSEFGSDCGCNEEACNHPSGKCSGSCYNCLYQVHFPGRFPGEIIKKQYDCQKMIYHYVCQYSYLYTTEIMWAIAAERVFIRGFPYYHILSLGCGGCADLMAFDVFLNKGRVKVPISYIGVDINTLWSPIHDEIKEYYSNDERVRFKIPEYKDVFDCFDTPLHKTNIIVMSYLISYLYNTNQTGLIDLLAERIAQNIVLKKEKNHHLLFIINDVNSNNRGRNYFSHFEKAIEKAGAKITNSDYMYFDTGNLNYYQTNGFSAHKNAKKCYFDIPAQLKYKYHAQESLNSTIQLLLEVE